MTDPTLDKLPDGFKGMSSDMGSDQTTFKGVNWGKAMMWIFLLSDTFDLKEYTLQSITGGTDALGEVVVRIHDQGRVFVGRSSSTDVLNSSAKAYINAINKMLNSRGDERVKPAL